MNYKRNENLFVLSNIINRFGDSVDLIAFMWLAYEVTGSLMLTGLVAAFNGLPSIILGLFSGILTDHYSKKRLVIIGDVVRGVIVTLIICLYRFHLLGIVTLCAGTILISTFEILSTPARRSIMPFLTDKARLREANSKNSSGKIIAQIAGLGIAGTIINQFGIAAAVMLDAVTFFISAALVFQIKYDDISTKVNSEYNSILTEIKESLYVIAKKNVILKTTIMATIINLFIGGFNVLALSFSNEVIGNGSQGQSMLNACNVIGILVLSTLFTYVKKKINMEKIINIGFLGLGISFLLFGLSTYSIAAYLVSFLYGLATGCITVTSVTILQSEIPLNHMGKVMAVVSLINESSIPFGNLIVGMMLQSFMPNTIFIIYGFFIISSTLLLLLIFFVKQKSHVVKIEDV